MIKARHPKAGFFFPVLALLLFFATRAAALDALPLHNDEGLHLTRAIEVWNGNPFWEIRDGKIINHWLIAAFYPQHAPVFAGRIATVLVAMPGFAALLALGRRLGMRATILGALLWLTSPLMFFYDRMAFSDAQAGALGLLALWAASKRALRQSRRTAEALLTGVLLALAMLFKFTAAPYALGVALLVMAQRIPLRDRLRTLAIIAAIVAAAFAVPVAVLLWRGSSLFDIALAWVGAGGGSGGLTLLDNLGRLAELLTWGNAAWAGLLLAGLVAAFAAGARSARLLALAGLLPLLVILVLGRDAQSRHFAAALPPLVAISGIGWAYLLRRVQPIFAPFQRMAGLPSLLLAVAAALLIIPFAGFAVTAYRSPAALEMPPLMAWQYVEGYASGYGLREAVEAFPQALTDTRLQVIGSMYGDSCRRANFYAVGGRAMLCGDAPMRLAIDAALARDGAVYALVERGGEIGIDVATVDARATLLASYPRPHETEADASVRLWLLER